MYSKRISIIVPIYNVSAFLPKCLDTIASQLRDDWELILVNDGSTDDSLQICKAFAEGRNNVRIVNKTNGGLSDARNAGTVVAIGEWIYYIDSDDWLVVGAIQKLYDFAKKNQCEVVQGGVYYAYSDHLLYRNPTKIEAENTVLDNNEAMHQLILNDRVKNFAWGKLYRADLIRDLKFPVGKYFEDSYWQHLVMHRVTSYGIIDEPLYYYRQRETSISGEFSAKNLDLLKGYEARIGFIEENYPSLLPEMVHKYWNLLFSFYNQACSTANIEKLYSEYYFDSLARFSKLFSRCLSYTYTWRFKNDDVLLKIYRLFIRVWNHFFSPSNYCRLPINDE